MNAAVRSSPSISLSGIREIADPRVSDRERDVTAASGLLPGWHSFRMDHGSGVMVCTRSG